ncbi:MAG TPA: hypothetical protein VMS76_08810 [Planctomycetota bacterium]|nr:hypothetical protein [Planctomycetota bacterium]
MCKALLLTCVAASLCLASASPMSPASPRGEPPVCDPGGPYTTSCSGPLSVVRLDGSGSYDPEGQWMWYQWIETSPDAFIDDPTSPTPNLIFSMAQACERVVRVALIVTAGGESTRCVTFASARDDSEPDLDVPPDVQVKRGDPLHPDHTGWAVAYDLCNPGCSLAWEDTVSASAPAQGVTVIDRTWTGDDGCRRAQGVQRITVVP